MKTGMNLLLWTDHVTEEHFPLLAKLKKAGFDGVEVPMFGGDLAHYQKIGKELKNLGLGATAVTVCGKDNNPISPEARVRQAGLAHIKNAIEWTAALGGDNLCGPYHSAIGEFSGQPPTADEKAHGADIMRQAAEHAAKHKVTLAVEYLNRFECYFLTTAADAVAFVKAVDHPSCRTMYDTFHANIEEKDLSAAIAHIAPYMAHVHVSENDRGTPGTGHVHWDESFKAIRKAGYDGWVVIESFGRALPGLAAATKVWRDLFPSAEEVYTKGLELIRKKWAQHA